MNKISYFILILLALAACGQSKKNTAKDEKKESTLESIDREKVLSTLTDKYSIKYSLDTLDFDYSIQFQDLLNTNYQLTSWFRILDIYRQDSIYYVRIEMSFYNKYHLNLIISETELEKLLAHHESYLVGENIAMVVSLKEIMKIDNPFNSTRFGSFEGKGEVIEVQRLNE